MRKRTIRNSIIASNLALLLVVFAIVVHHTSAAQTTGETATLSATNSSNDESVTNPLNQLTTAQIAVQVARMTGIYEATSVSNLADSEDAAINVVQTDNQVVAKPQIVSTDAKSREDIVKYVTQPGDTLSSLAVKFGVTSNSIMWSNSIISGNTLSSGLTLYIPPINGVVYSVKAGDTAASLAQKFNADSSQITSFNDAELSGLTTGEQIVIPNGSDQAAAASSSSSSSLSSGGYGYSFGYGPVYGNNGYDYGYCTWWVAQQRAAVGEPVPSNLGNASTWLLLAQEAGIPTGAAAEPSAVVWFGYSANHVAYVQSVNPDGSVVISEMNRDGWAVEDTRVLSPQEAAQYKYIY